MRKILGEQRIVARDQNKVFVELASARKLSPADAEDKYGLSHGKGNAFVEFDIKPKLLKQQYNRRLGIYEYYVIGDVELAERDAEAFFNI